MDEKKKVAPTPGFSRLELIDIFRGFAVFGILVVNLEIMNCMIVNQGIFGQQWGSIWDNFSYRIMQLFFYSKFFPIFSFLFGLGVGMQTFKLADSTHIPYGFLMRRMGILFLFGVLHISFLWSGDILHLYAIIGVITLPLLNQRSYTLLGLSFLLFVFPYYDTVFELSIRQLDLDLQYWIRKFSPEEIVAIIRQGSFRDQVYLRWADYFSNVPLLIGFLAPVALSMYLLGLFFAKKKLVYGISSFIVKSKRPMLFVFSLITAYRLFFIFWLPELGIYQNPTYRPVFLQLIFLADVLTGLFYLWLMGWIYQFKWGKNLLTPFSYVGKMALTNYILQSVIGLFIFYSIGFSLYETLSPPVILLTALLIFTLQLFLSKYWLNFFKFGPLEWVWRVLSYGRIFRIKK